MVKAFYIIGLLCVLWLGAVAQQQEMAPVERGPTQYMFVQTAHSGSLIPVTGKENLYLLVLKGVSPQTIGFSDRPERIVGQISTQTFLEVFCFSPTNPPNVAIELLEGAEDADVIVAELFDPVYDATNHTLQCKLRILKEPNHSYAIFNERHDPTLPQSFGPVTLFIDDCPDGVVKCCARSDQYSGEACCQYTYPKCWSWWPPGCSPCFSRDDEPRCEEECGHGCPYECRTRFHITFSDKNKDG